MNIQAMREWIPSFEGIDKEAIFTAMSSVGEKMAQVAKDCFKLIAYTASCVPKFFEDGFQYGVVYYAREEREQGVLNALSRLGLIKENSEQIPQLLASDDFESITI